jgi:hypothetical protein
MKINALQPVQSSNQGALLSRMFMACLFALSLASCATKAPSNKAAVDKAQFSYTAVCRTPRSALPYQIYFFPPLLSDNKGRPKQAMKPKMDASGGIAGWQTPSEKSRRFLNYLTKQAEKSGYQVVTFKDVLAMKEPYTILIVSSFYTEPQATENPKPGQPDRFFLCKLKGSTFDLNLNPATSKNIANVDGATVFYQHQDLQLIEQKSLESSASWLGDDVSGFLSIKL